MLPAAAEIEAASPAGSGAAAATVAGAGAAVAAAGEADPGAVEGAGAEVPGAAAAPTEPAKPSWSVVQVVHQRSEPNPSFPRYSARESIIETVGMPFLVALNTAAATVGDVKRIIGPVANGREIVKCAMQQYEDLVDPDRDDLSRVGLSMQIRGLAPDTGTCVVDQGQLYGTVTDDTPDDKHMVATLDSYLNIEGRCVQLTWDPTVISSAGSVTTITYCGVDDALDY